MPDENSPLTPEEENALDHAFVEAAQAAAPEASVQPEVPVPEVSEPVVAEPELSAAMRAAQEAGLDISGYKSDEDLVRDINRRLGEYQPYVEYAKSVLPYDQQIRQLVSGQQQPKQPEPEPAKAWDPEAHFREKWQTPQYDKAWETFVQAGMVNLDPETGQFIANPKYATSVPAPVLQGLNQRRTWQRQALERLLENPFQETWQALQDPLERLIQDKIQSYVQQYDSVQNLNAWEQQHARELYEHDERGQVVQDIYGNMKPTPYGEVFIRAAQDARQRFPGISNDDILKYAEALATPHKAQAAHAAPETPAAPVAAPEKEKPFLQKALERASHSPNAGGYAEATDIEPMVLETRELEQMFLTASKKAGL